MKKNITKKQAVSLKKDENSIEVSINVPIKFKLPNTPTNFKFIIVFLRLLIGLNGKRVCTFQRIANLCGHHDRRNIDNFWREFGDHNHEILPFLSRKVDFESYVPMIEDIVANNIILPVAEMHRKFVRKHKLKMSITTFKKYLAKVISPKLHKSISKILIEATSGDRTVNILRLLADQNRVPIICDNLLEQVESNKPEPKPKSEMKSSLQRQNLCLLVHYLVASGLNLQTIAMLLNISKASVSNLWHEIDDLPSLILNSIDKWSGKISIDEKYIKIKEIPHYVITIMDFETKIPLYLNVYANATKESYEECFRVFKQIYKREPSLIVSDGSYALKAGKMAVFPKVPHQLCKFHKIRNLFRMISKNQKNEYEGYMFKQKVIKGFRRKTVSGRKKAMKALTSILPKPAARYVDSNIIKQWSYLTKSLTSNVSERFNRKIKKVMSGRYGLKSVKTAANLANSLWLKELIDHGRYILQDESLIANLNISQICQEKIDWDNLDLLFSKNAAKVA